MVGPWPRAPLVWRWNFAWSLAKGPLVWRWTFGWSLAKGPLGVEVDVWLVPGQGPLVWKWTFACPWPVSSEIGTVSQVLLASYITARNPQTLNTKKAIPRLTIVVVICVRSCVSLIQVSYWCKHVLIINFLRSCVSLIVLA